MLAGILRAIEHRQMLFISVFALTVSLGLGWHAREASKRLNVAPNEFLATDARATLECVPIPGQTFHYNVQLHDAGPNGEVVEVQIKQPEHFRPSIQGKAVVLNEQLEFVRLADTSGTPSQPQAVALWIFIGSLLATASSLIFARRAQF